MTSYIDTSIGYSDCYFLSWYQNIIVSSCHTEVGAYLVFVRTILSTVNIFLSIAIDFIWG